jgi:hypothetical protein
MPNGALHAAPSAPSRTPERDEGLKGSACSAVDSACRNESEDSVALRSCRECGKQISTDANPCPHCGKKNPHGMSKLVKYGGGFLAVMFGLPLMVGMCAGGTRSASSGASTVQAEEARPAPAVPPLAVHAVRLWKDYEANEVAADNAYRGRPLLVTGVVSGVRKDFTDDMILELQSPNEFMDTTAELKGTEGSIAAQLKKGMPVEVVCQDVRRIVGSPRLSDCVFPR